MAPILVHGTAIRLGATGLILVGPSGSGKSSLALALMASARRAGHFSALVGDDQVFVEQSGDGVHANAPPNIVGKIEIRGSGIGTVAAIERARMDLAVMPVAVTAENRIPAEGQRFELAPGIWLPLLCMDRSTIDPLAVLEAMLPNFPG